MGLVRMAARTAVVAGTATAVSGRVARRQNARWAEDNQAAVQPADGAEAAGTAGSPRGRQDGGTAEPGPAPQPGSAHGRGVRRGEGETAGNLAPAVIQERVGQVDAYTRLAGVYDEIVVDPCHGAWASFLHELWSDDEHGVHHRTRRLLRYRAARRRAGCAGVPGGRPGWFRGDARPRPATGRVEGAAQYDRRFPHWPSKAYTTPRPAPLTALTTSLRPISARRSPPCPFASARPDGSSWTTPAHGRGDGVHGLPTRGARRAG